MILIVYILAVCLFTLAFIFLKLNKNFSLIVSVSRHAVSILNNKQLADITKETETQKAALQLFKQAALILLKSVIIISFTAIPFALADTLGIVSWGEATEFSLRADVLIYTLIIMSAAVFIVRAIKVKKP